MEEEDIRCSCQPYRVDRHASCQHGPSWRKMTAQVLMGWASNHGKIDKSMKQLTFAAGVELLRQPVMHGVGVAIAEVGGHWDVDFEVDIIQSIRSGHSNKSSLWGLISNG